MLTSSMPPVSEVATPLAAPATGAGLRVAIVSDAAPERNGVGAYYRDLAEHLKAAGARVDLISPRFRAGNWYGGLAMPLPGDPTQRFLFPSLSLVSRRMERLAPTAVIIPTPGLFGMLGMYLAKRYGARLLVGFHTHFERLTELNDHSPLFGAMCRSYLGACNRRLFDASDLVLANSTEMLEIARAIGARHADLMGTSVPKRFLDAPPLPLRPRVERVLFAGRLAPEKNLGAVVEAASACPDLQFQIVGDGPLRDWVQAQADRLPNLTYQGWVRRNQIMPLIDRMDVLVLPSTVESFGTIALEAMARARLVIVSARCGILSWEELSRGLFPMREDEPLAAALGRVAALDPGLRQRKAELARAAAIDINTRNLAYWLRVLRAGDPGGLDGAPG